MYIIIKVNQLNKLEIDPNISINSGCTEGYILKFVFDKPWPQDLRLYAVFKPSLDIPMPFELNNNNEVMIPRLLLKRFQKLGIGLKGVKKDTDDVAINTSYYRLPVDIGAI